MIRAARLAAAASIAAYTPAALAAVVVVDKFEGAKSKDVREAVESALEKGDHEVVKIDQARVPASADRDVYVKHAAEYHTAAFIDGEVEFQKGSGWSVTLTVRNGADGKALGDTTLDAEKLPQLLEKIDAEAARRLAGYIDQAAASAAETREEKSAHTEERPEESHGKSAPPAAGEQGRKAILFEVAGGIQMFSRNFEYHQDINNRLNAYRISLWPAPEVRVGYYPGAHLTNNMAANIGLVAGIARSFGASSGIGTATYDTTLLEAIVGPRFRMPVEGHEIAISLLYGQHSFELQSDHDPITVAANGLPVNRAYVPDVRYEYLRPGLDVRLAFGRLRFGAGLGYRAVLGLGQIASQTWFPYATARALDGFVNAGYEVIPGLYAMAGFDATRYALDMHTPPSDRTAPRDAAGGAIDLYLTGHVGVEYRFGASNTSSPE
jgi:hypothetical protein